LGWKGGDEECVFGGISSGGGRSREVYGGEEELEVVFAQELGGGEDRLDEWV
jgi:hypothetical protein